MNTKKDSWGSIVFFGFSFWSSGIFLVRSFGSYGFWNNQSVLLFIFFLSIPIVFFCATWLEKMFTKREGREKEAVYDTVGFTLLLHGGCLGFFPSLYGLAAHPSLGALAWLLWFGGIAVLITSRLK